MITAKQVRDKSYNEVVIWCERHLQPDILAAEEFEQKSIRKLFWKHEINPEELERVLKEKGFEVKVVNFTQQYRILFEYGEAYEVVVSWK